MVATTANANASGARRPLSLSSSSTRSDFDYGVKYAPGVEDLSSPVRGPGEGEGEGDAGPLSPTPPPYGAASSNGGRYGDRGRRYDDDNGGDRDGGNYGDYSSNEDGEEGYRSATLQSLGRLAKGLGLIFVGALAFPTVFWHDAARLFWSIPRAYGDDTVRPWPRITGFPSGCAAGGKALFFGMVDGLTDWFTLPARGARREGAAGFAKGLGRGLANMIPKLSYAGLAFIGHPLFGVYKEVANVKIVVERRRRSRSKHASPV